MIRVNFLLDESTFNFLKNLPGTISEHIRRAINEYIDKIKAQQISASQSERREKNE